MSGISRNEQGKTLLERTREIEKRALANPKIVEQKQKPNTRQLPVTPAGTRPIPNEFLRTAIFSVFDKGLRRHLENEKLASSEGIEVFFTGTTLSQEDLTAYTSLVAVGMSKLGEPFCATAYSVLKECGKADTGKNRTDLEGCLVRLRASTITIKQGGNTYITGFLERALKNSGSRHWEISLDPRIGNLFRSDNYTRLDWMVRRALKRRTMALWLHGYYESHRTPFPVKIETIHRLCGSKAKCMHDFKKKLRLALIAVSDASAGQGKKFDFEIKDGMVYVSKSGKKNART